MTVTEAAETLNVSGQRIRQLIAAGKLEAEKVGRHVWLLNEAGVLARKQKQDEQE
jgi:excisionase family DNA binding protein